VGSDDDRDDAASTLSTDVQVPSSAPAATYRLTVVEGADCESAYTVDGSQPGPALLGHSPTCDFRLTDRRVSRRHATLELDGRKLRVNDLGSTNGCFVNGVEVTSAVLRDGDVLRLGETVVAVQLLEAATVVHLAEATSFGRVVGASAEMRRLYPLCERLAASSVPVIIEGETGTGKEVLAESIHDLGPRANGPFVVLDCTSLPPSLAEAELFGHEKGAFTGAVGARRGVFEQAHGGTLLIDEIGDLEASLQPKLLRAIERSEVRRIGSERVTRFDVRVLCATRRDLDREVQAGRFRDDLFHRLAVARIELPPLRKRKGDVSLLANHCARELGHGSRLPEAVLLRWEQDPWTGNVRELRNAVARHLTLGDLAQVSETENAPAEASGSKDLIEALLADGVPFARARARVISAFEERYIAALLAAHGGSVRRAAEATGIARRQFQRVNARTKRRGQSED
jgi:DNA-binding NtrC family response regulator